MELYRRYRDHFDSAAQLRHFLRMAWWARHIRRWRDAQTVPGILGHVEPRGAAPVDAERTHLYLRYIFRRRWLMPLSNCYTRSLLRYKFLREAGLPVELVMGIRKEASGEFKAHAWIELDGQPYRETEDCAYTPTLRHPPRKEAAA